GSPGNRDRIPMLAPCYLPPLSGCHQRFPLCYTRAGAGGFQGCLVADDHQRAHAVLSEVLKASDPKTRAELLDSHCSGDPELRQRVEELLREHEAGLLLSSWSLPVQGSKGGVATKDPNRKTTSPGIAGLMSKSSL